MTLTTIKKAGLDEIALDHVFTIGASGTDHYTFQGEGLNGTVNDPTLYLTRGKTYRFENGTGAHAIRIQSADDGTSGTLYNTGVTNNNTTGTVIVEVQHDAPDVLYYQCASHANMKGTIYITGALSDGGVTTAKIADNAVTSAKIPNDAVTGDELASNSVTSAHIVNGAITNTDINASAAIAGSKISPSFTSDITVTNSAPKISFVDTNADSDFQLKGNAGKFEIIDTTNNAERFRVNSDGHVDVMGNLDVGAGIDVTGNITVSGTVDGVDIAALNTTVGNITTDVVSDTSPQLGGELDTNGSDIRFADTDEAIFGNGADLKIYHEGGSGDNIIKNNVAGKHLKIQHNDGSAAATFYNNTSVELYNSGNKKLETTSTGITVTGTCTATAFSGDGSALTGVSAGGASNISFNSGNGINFAADSNASGMSSEVFDDYETGSWTPTLTRANGNIGGTLHSSVGGYVKVGKLVYVTFNIYRTSASGGSSYYVLGALPFGVDTTNQGSWAMSAHMTRSHWDGDNTGTSNRQISFKFLGGGNTYGYSANIDTNGWYTSHTNVIVATGQFTYITSS